MSDPIDLCWLRTSCLLVRYRGITAITDPWFGRTMRGLPVFRRPAIALAALPRIDCVIATHLHRDHFDPRAVARFGHRDLQIAGTPGTADFVRAHVPADRVGHVVDVPAWTSTALGPFVLHATPAEHTAPGPAEINYVIEAGEHRIFFGGDARWSRHYAAIALRHARIDLALLPVGGTLIFGHRTTLDPADAVRVCGVLQPRYALPIHEGGEWMPVPPLSRHPGRAADFERLLRASPHATEPVRVEPGQWVRLDGAMSRIDAP